MIDLLSVERMGANNYDGYIFVIKTPLKLLSPPPGFRDLCFAFDKKQSELM